MHPMLFIMNQNLLPSKKAGFPRLQLGLPSRPRRDHCRILTVHQADAYIQQQASRLPEN